MFLGIISAAGIKIRREFLKVLCEFEQVSFSPFPGQNNY